MDNALTVNTRRFPGNETREGMALTIARRIIAVGLTHRYGRKQAPTATLRVMVRDDLHWHTLFIGNEHGQNLGTVSVYDNGKTRAHMTYAAETVARALAA